MALAETANLAVNLTLGGNFNAGLTQAESSLSRFSTAATTRTAGALGAVGTAAGKMGGALSHAGSQLKGLIAGPLGIIGLTGGLLSFGGAMTSTLSKLNDLAFGTEKLQSLTGGSAQTISTLIAATEKYGITLDKLTVTAGFYEKAIGKLEITDKLTEFQKIFNVTLVDSKGKALGFADALLSVADVYSKSTDKAKSAALAAALFGRSYTGLIPVLALGRKGILELEQEAAKMGLQLSAKNVADFAMYRKAIRESQESIAGLQVAIGEDLLPTITELANGVSKFVSEHKNDIVAFFHNAVQVGKDAAKTIGGFASAVGAFWSSIPGPVRDLLVKGLVADRTVKFLFGFSPIGSLIGDLEKGVANGFGRSIAAAGIGKLFVQPVFVTNPGFGGGGIPGLAGKAAGAAGLAEGAAGIFGLSITGVVAAVAAVIGVPLAVAIIAKNAGFAQGISDPRLARGAPAGTGKFGSFAAPMYSPIAGPTTIDLIRNASEDRAIARKTGEYIQSNTDALTGLTGGLSKFRDSLVGMTVPDILKGIHARSAARYGGTGLGASAVEGTFERDLLHHASLIAKSGETQAQKLRDLAVIQADLRGHGDRHVQGKLQTLINDVKHMKTTVNVTIPITVRKSEVIRLTTTNSGTGGGGLLGGTVQS